MPILPINDVLTVHDIASFENPAKVLNRCFNDQANRDHYGAQIHIGADRRAGIRKWFLFLLETHNEKYSIRCLHKMVTQLVFSTHNSIELAVWYLSCILKCNGSSRLAMRIIEKLYRCHNKHLLSPSIYAQLLDIPCTTTNTKIQIKLFSLRNYKVDVYTNLQNFSVLNESTIRYIASCMKESDARLFKKSMECHMPDETTMAYKLYHSKLYSVYRTIDIVKSIVALKIFIKRYREYNAVILKGECVICLEQNRLYTLHDSDVRHAVCKGCKVQLFKSVCVACPMCRKSIVDAPTRYMYDDYEEYDPEYDYDDYNNHRRRYEETYGEPYSFEEYLQDLERFG